MKKFTKALFIGVLLALGFIACSNDVAKSGIFDGRTYVDEENWDFRFEKGQMFMAVQDGELVFNYSTNGNKLTFSFVYALLNGKKVSLEEYCKDFQEKEAEYQGEEIEDDELAERVELMVEDINEIFAQSFVYEDKGDTLVWHYGTNKVETLTLKK